MILLVNQVKTATLEGLDASGNPTALTENPSFTNSNPAVLGVTPEGPTNLYSATLRGLSVGTARLTVTVGSLTTELDVTVAEPGVVALAINVS